MLIVHVVRHSLVQRTPARTACYWGRYTQHRGDSICSGRAGGRGQFKEPLNPYGIFYTQGKRKQMTRLLESADVVHCHDDAYPTMYGVDPRKKRCVYHAHIGDIPKRYFKTGRFSYHPKVRHAAITNGYGRHFDEEERRSGAAWGRLPDVLDIHHPTLSPANAPKPDKFRVVFTYSNKHEPGRKINAKGPRTTQRLVNGIRNVDFRFVHGVKFEDGMREKQAAHVVLDEVFSPYTHLSALEGAAVGACVLTSYDKYTVRELCRVVSAPEDSYPFVQVDKTTLRGMIEHLRDNRDEAAEYGRRAREWMVKYYNPRRLLDLYLAFYGFPAGE